MSISMHPSSIRSSFTRGRGLPVPFLPPPPPLSGLPCLSPPLSDFLPLSPRPPFFPLPHLLPPFHLPPNSTPPLSHFSQTPIHPNNQTTATPDAGDGLCLCRKEQEQEQETWSYSALQAEEQEHIHCINVCSSSIISSTTLLTFLTCRHRCLGFPK